MPAPSVTISLLSILTALAGTPSVCRASEELFAGIVRQNDPIKLGNNISITLWNIHSNTRPGTSDFRAAVPGTDPKPAKWQQSYEFEYDNEWYQAVIKKTMNGDGSELPSAHVVVRKTSSRPEPVRMMGRVFSGPIKEKDPIGLDGGVVIFLDNIHSNVRPGTSNFKASTPGNDPDPGTNLKVYSFKHDGLWFTTHILRTFNAQDIPHAEVVTYRTTREMSFQDVSPKPASAPGTKKKSNSGPMCGFRRYSEATHCCCCSPMTKECEARSHENRNCYAVCNRASFH